MKNKTIPARSEVEDSNKWDLSSLYVSDNSWEKDFQNFGSRILEVENFRGRLGRSPEIFAECLELMTSLNRQSENLAVYAHLKMSEDAGDSENQKRVARITNAAAKYETLSSFFHPELHSIEESLLKDYMNREDIKPFSIMLSKVLRYKPHILSEAEEKLLALQIESSQTASKAFNALTDADLEFGFVETPEGAVPLSQSSFAFFMLNQDRELREKAYKQFYAHFLGHKNTLSALYAGSVHQDIYMAKARNFPTARAAALFPDKMPEQVYDTLVAAVRENLPALHKYYSLRKKLLGVSELRHYDVYVPLLKTVSSHYTYEEAVDIIHAALGPLGDDYRNTLRSGLLGSWVDRYENKGKRSGAFSWGAYGSDPYILMNYKEEVLRDLFTLAHEGGHSMHSYYSRRANPFQHYEYTIFEAEVASTFNEQLLGKHLLSLAEDREKKAYLIGKAVDDIIATIFRQTMFAEYEHICHSLAEKGEPLSVDVLRGEYRKLLSSYFGPEMVLEEESDMEGLRIPHFYRAFYVYKYATGLSAAIYLSEMVMAGGKSERERYLSFLASGGSRFPLESLAMAGVDMEKPEPVLGALNYFRSQVEELSRLLSFKE